MDSVEIDVVDAAHIHRGHFGPIRHLTKRERFDAAIRTELVTNDVLIEKIFPRFSFASCLRKLGNRRESENQSALFADRTIARNCFGQINIRSKAKIAAMTAA